MEELVVYGSTPYSDAETFRTKAHNPQIVVPSSILSVHELHKGAPVHSFKKLALPSAPTAPRADMTALHCLDASYTRVVAPVHNSAQLAVYTWTRETPDQTIVVPEKLSAVRVSPSGLWLVGGAFSGRLFVWELASGNLVAVRDAHYQEVTQLEFSADEVYLFSGAADARVLGWRLVDLVKESSASATSHSGADTASSTKGSSDSGKPAVSWSGHMLPVTGLSVGYGTASSGISVYSSSLDNTVRIHNLDLSLTGSSGKSASANSDFTFVFPSKVTALAVDPADRAFYAGLANGTIYAVNLYAPSSATSNSSLQSILFQNNSNTLTIDDSTASFAAPVWSAENANTPVTCLGLSFDATTLAAGAADGVVTIIDLPTQTVARTLPPHSGPISALRVVARVQPAAHDLVQRGKMSAIALTPSQTSEYRRVPQLKRVRAQQDLDEHDVWIQIGDEAAATTHGNEEDAFEDSLAEIEDSRRSAGEFGLQETSESALRTRLQKSEADYLQLQGMYSELSNMHAELWKLHSK